MEVFAPTPLELVKNYGARKTSDERYEVSTVNLPWAYRQQIDMAITPDKSYAVEGVSIEGLSPPWEAYVALVNEAGEYGVGYIVSRRRSMFRCVYKTYTKPMRLQTPPYLVIKPVELYLTDREGVVNCIDKSFHAKYIVVFINAPVELLRTVKVAMSPVVKEIFKYQHF